MERLRTRESEGRGKHRKLYQHKATLTAVHHLQSLIWDSLHESFVFSMVSHESFVQGSPSHDAWREACLVTYEESRGRGERQKVEGRG
jgi:hypothetical protein